MMRYPTGAYAFRQKFGGKKQIFQIMSRSAKPEDFKNLAERTLAKLNADEDADSVKAWAKGQALLV